MSGKRESKLQLRTREQREEFIETVTFMACVVEAAGNVGVLLKKLEKAEAPRSIMEDFRKIAPRSRGGMNNMDHAEETWGALVDIGISRMGLQRFMELQRSIQLNEYPDGDLLEHMPRLNLPAYDENFLMDSKHL